jgi:hypothetical protein
MGLLNNAHGHRHKRSPLWAKLLFPKAHRDERRFKIRRLMLALVVGLIAAAATVRVILSVSQSGGFGR